MDILFFYAQMSLIGICVLILLSFIPSIIWWFTALLSGVKISVLQIWLMKFRNVSARVIVQSLIESYQAGLQLQRKELESLYMSKGNVKKVVRALISANKANIDLSYDDAVAIDLAGRDVLEAVRTSVNPKVIDTPAVEAVAQNGIQVIVKARITIRSNLKKLIGGAGEDTIKARVGECIVTTIGSSETHEKVMGDPHSISKVILDRHLDENTAFDILSVDIADVDYGKNVGAQLLIEKAESEKSIAQSKAEEKRAMAIALEQEMKAKKMEAEAAVPLALAKAIEDGNIGFMDYQRYLNLTSQTQMQNSFAGLNSISVSASKKDDFFTKD